MNTPLLTNEEPLGHSWANFPSQDIQWMELLFIKIENFCVSLVHEHKGNRARAFHFVNNTVCFLTNHLKYYGIQQKIREAANEHWTVELNLNGIASQIANQNSWLTVVGAHPIHMTPVYTQKEIRCKLWALLVLK